MYINILFGFAPPSGTSAACEAFVAPLAAVPGGGPAPPFPPPPPPPVALPSSFPPLMTASFNSHEQPTCENICDTPVHNCNNSKRASAKRLLI